MYCSKCGKQINDESKFCQFCGAQVGTSLPKFLQTDYIKSVLTPPPIQNQQNDYTQYENYQQNYYQQDQHGYSQQANLQVYPAQTAQQLPMNWYKFVIWVQLFLSALLLAVQGLLHITGLRYGGNRALVYRYTPGLLFLDIVFGFGYLVLAALSIIARQQLAHYKKNSPMLLLGVYFIQMPFTVVYSLLYALVGGYSFFEPTILGTLIGTLIGSGALIGLSYVYFDKRKSYFNR